MALTSLEADEPVSSRRLSERDGDGATTTLSPSISTRTPVRIGSVSPRSAAIDTWLTAVAKVTPSIVPLACGCSGSVG